MHLPQKTSGDFPSRCAEKRGNMKLSSGAEEKIELTDFTKREDEGFKCQLNVISGPFTADIEFWFDISSAREVIECLVKLMKIQEQKQNSLFGMSNHIFSSKEMDSVTLKYLVC
jgi:hypothetical protein